MMHCVLHLGLCVRGTMAEGRCALAGVLYAHIKPDTPTHMPFRSLIMTSSVIMAWLPF